jgi:hypothetical protein
LQGSLILGGYFYSGQKAKALAFVDTNEGLLVTRPSLQPVGLSGR